MAGTRSPGAAPLLLGLALLALCAPGRAQPYPVPPTWGGSLAERPRLTGDWDGVRDELAKKGMVLDLDVTQYVQGVSNGGADKSTRYGGIAELSFNLDTQKAGLWPGGFLNLQVTSNFGGNVNSAAGSVIPPNFPSMLPNFGANGTELMNLSFMQFFSPQFGVFAGKLSQLGGDNNAFAHDYHSQFMSMGLNLNPVLALFPMVSYGAGAVYLPAEGVQIAGNVVGASGAAAEHSIRDSFRDGIVASLEGRMTVEPGGLVGHQLLGALWSNKKRLSLEQDPDNIARMLLAERFSRLGELGPVLKRILERFFPGLLVPVQPPNTENSTWAVYYNFDQYLWSPAGRPDAGVGVFGRFGVSDGTANPIKRSYNLGVGGKGIVPGRPQDQFGIGWSRARLSDKLAPFLRDQLDLGLKKDDAVELYYSAALTKSISASAHLQFVNSAFNKTLDSSQQLQNLDRAVVAGMRVYARF
jgi:porin